MKIAAIVITLAALAAGACASQRAAPVAAPSNPQAPVAAPAAPPAPVADARLGLVPGSVFDVPSPPAVKANESGPGETPVLPRPWPGAPPRISHGVEDFLPITANQNSCLECHAVKEKKAGEATPIPVSHYTDYRNAPDRVDARVIGARYVCVSCHAATTDAPSLVQNRFRP